MPARSNCIVDTERRSAMLPRASMPAPRPLSVIIINQNGGTRLGEVLASVGEQRFVEPDVIIVDRGSTDESRRWLAGERTAPTTIVSADGATHAAAANRGVAAARGEWLLFLGCRDRLAGDMILSECLNWMKTTEAGVVAGEAASDDGRLARMRSRVNPLARDFLPRSATFYRRTLFDENGEFDCSLEAMAAYEYHVRLWKSRIRFKPIPLRVSACSGAPRFNWRACCEEIRTRHRYFPAWRCWAWDALSLLRCMRPQRRSA